MKSRYKYLVLFLFLFAIFASIKLMDANLGSLGKEVKNISNSSSDISSTGSSISSGMIIVEISGAVIKPGVYSLNIDSRVQDLINLAGGIDNANIDLNMTNQSINKAQKLKDQQKVYIPLLQTLSVTSSMGITAKSAISINNGTYEELLSLNGVGDVIAKKIINSRYYSSVDELVSKKVISSSLLDKISSSIRL
ncbi:MAG: helix-hairpin-helix domain-containing protein [bacterium]